MPYAKKEKSGKDAYDKGDMKTGMKPRRSRKKVCPFFLLENSRPLSPWGPLDSLSTCLGNDYLNIFVPWGSCCSLSTCGELTLLQVSKGETCCLCYANETTDPNPLTTVIGLGRGT